MEKKEYKEPEMEITKFETEDVVADTSGHGGGAPV